MQSSQALKLRLAHRLPMAEKGPQVMILTNTVHRFLSQLTLPYKLCP